ncbi:hypothetical protein Q4577_01050 [Marinovum sp. 2_MG-2023]|uniref:ImuA family protein n=1 Tax=unclassified Marinovum TaxID=2647166 RepID=UPI0026E2C590|nr:MULTISPECIES: hypothetical protein [unclassified Marinovum]MDO6728584.1 hypothetical protein [Marinovum sp. 2_MG-2023]MDO6778000.1 hypothetical protein [Marinovum sp. 1_MG-2023]
MSRHHALLTRAPHKSRPALTVMGDISLAQMRVHEICGLARRTLAVWIADAVQRSGPGPVIWVSPPWERDDLFATGLAQICAPERFLFVRPKRAEDILWTLEEVLRSGAVPLVVGDLPGFPSLTQVRRMHLAAEAGAEALGGKPLGLLLTPGQSGATSESAAGGVSGGAPGVETRWSLTPAHTPETPGWRLTRLRARTAPVRSWRVQQGADGPELLSVSAPDRLPPDKIPPDTQAPDTQAPDTCAGSAPSSVSAPPPAFAPTAANGRSNRR